MLNKNTYWLASYPKSGNTWFRMFLNQLIGPEQALNLNDLQLIDTIASSRQVFDTALGVNSSDMLSTEIDYLRPFSDEIFNECANSKVFRKIHDAFISPYSNQPIIPTTVSAGIIYIIRNPLDVLVSYHYHLNKTIDETMQHLNGQDDSIDQRKAGIKTQFHQYMGGWSHHVLSWAQQTSVPVCVIRYEDLLKDPVTHFNKATRFSQISHTKEELEKAIQETQFEKLKQQESKARFAETPNHSNQFFRKGRSGSWREYLSKRQLEQVLTSHAEIMRKFGYLDELNNPVF